MAEFQLPKLATRVRFPSPAPSPSGIRTDFVGLVEGSSIPSAPPHFSWVISVSLLSDASLTEAGSLSFYPASVGDATQNRVLKEGYAIGSTYIVFPIKP